jgi:hypothetical protein
MVVRQFLKELDEPFLDVELVEQIDLDCRLLL